MCVAIANFNVCGWGVLVLWKVFILPGNAKLLDFYAIFDTNLLQGKYDVNCERQTRGMDFIIHITSLALRQQNISSWKLRDV